LSRCGSFLPNIPCPLFLGRCCPAMNTDLFSLLAILVCPFPHFPPKSAWAPPLSSPKMKGFQRFSFHLVGVVAEIAVSPLPFFGLPHLAPNADVPYADKLPFFQKRKRSSLLSFFLRAGSPPLLFCVFHGFIFFLSREAPPPVKRGGLPFPFPGCQSCPLPPFLCNCLAGPSPLLTRSSESAFLLGGPFSPPLVLR